MQDSVEVAWKLNLKLLDDPAIPILSADPRQMWAKQTSVLPLNCSTTHSSQDGSRLSIHPLRTKENVAHTRSGILLSCCEMAYKLQNGRYWL